MTNTHDEVVIPRRLAHQLKVILMDLADYWNRHGDEDKRDRVNGIASDLIVAEKPGSKSTTEQDHLLLRDLTPR
jgi:hypothetical protein